MFGILRLRRNLGHQRAIAIGLAFVHARRDEALVVIMDADGEDQPSDIPRLIAKCSAERGVPIVFAERTKRSESRTFRTFYLLYRAFHRILTGHSVRVGNFSVLPWDAIGSLVAVSDIWNHYAAAVVKARIPWTAIPTIRGSRLAGSPTMDFTALVGHGLSALAVFVDTVGVRLLTAALALVTATMAGLAIVVGVRARTPLAIPGWAAFAGGLLLLAIVQAGVVGFLFTLAILSNRAVFTFIVARDYHYFIKGFRVMTNE